MSKDRHELITDALHNSRTTALQAQVCDYFTRKVAFRVYHGSTNSTRILSFKRSEMVDVSDLDRVIRVDTERQVVTVEPNVPMDKLVRATLKYGLVPPVIPEFPGITVGGAIQGTAAETSSHRWGCFSQTAARIEMILGNGDRVVASPEENADLFYGTAGASGSLGLITAAEIKLVPATKYVNVTHYPVSSFAEGVELMTKYAKENADFIEWVMLSKTRGAIVIGTLSNSRKGRVIRVSRPHDPWYYLYVKDAVNSGESATNSLPLKDYLFRFNRGAFWAAELAFTQSGLPFNRFSRLILDPWLRTRKLYQALQASAASQVYICQDLVLPQETVVPFLDFVDKEFNMYPIGGCPIKPEPRSKLQCNGLESELVFNIGVYGLQVTPYEKFVEANRRIEAKTAELGGKKWLYAQNFYSEQEFWRIYDKTWYDALRRKYHATTLPDIFNRTRVKKRYDVSKRRGALKMMLGRAKLRVRD